MMGSGGAAPQLKRGAAPAAAGTPSTTAKPPVRMAKTDENKLAVKKTTSGVKKASAGAATNGDGKRVRFDESVVEPTHGKPVGLVPKRKRTEPANPYAATNSSGRGGDASAAAANDDSLGDDATSASSGRGVAFNHDTSKRQMALLMMDD